MTRLIVLAMLDIQPMSGYDIQQMLKMTDAERWAGVLIGSIYHALKKLEEEGYVEVHSIEQTGHRQKAVYGINDKGRGHLKDLISDCLKQTSVIYPSNLYSALSFYHKLSDKDVIEALAIQQRKLDDEFKAVENGLIEKKAYLQNHVPPMTMLIFDNMFKTIQLQQEFVKKALDLLSSKQ